MKFTLTAAALCVLGTTAVANNWDEARVTYLNDTIACGNGASEIGEEIERATCLQNAGAKYVKALTTLRDTPPKVETAADTTTIRAENYANRFMYSKAVCADQEGTDQHAACVEAAKNNFQKELPKKPVTKKVEAPKNGSFRVIKTKSQIDDSPAVFVSVFSRDRKSMGRYKDPAQLELTIRCLENTTSLIMSHSNAFFSNVQGFGKVRMRLDGGQAFTRSMISSTDHSSLGLWSGGKSIPVVKRMFDTEKLLVEIQAYNVSPKTFTFNIRGVKDAVKPLREACNW
ncbi:type VI secretion system-associated protein TagO [Algirhabdus cladophorae]|uniref:type VI secretion system-associated protein TagO n=1 Tax=Algirhabdus cladophorae TaxID=3377108 RepID=UPI003B84A4CF